MRRLGQRAPSISRPPAPIHAPAPGPGPVVFSDSGATSPLVCPPPRVHHRPGHPRRRTGARCSRAPPPTSPAPPRAPRAAATTTRRKKRRRTRRPTPGPRSPPFPTDPRYAPPPCPAPRHAPPAPRLRSSVYLICASTRPPLPLVYPLPAPNPQFTPFPPPGGSPQGIHPPCRSPPTRRDPVASHSFIPSIFVGSPTPLYPT